MNGPFELLPDGRLAIRHTPEVAALLDARSRRARTDWRRISCCCGGCRDWRKSLGIKPL